MDSRRTGNEVERRAAEILVRAGWTVWRPSSCRHHKPYSSADIFGAFDIVAAREIGGEYKMRWIQVKSGAAGPDAATRDLVYSTPVLGSKEIWMYDRETKTFTVHTRLYEYLSHTYTMTVGEGA